MVNEVFVVLVVVLATSESIGVLQNSLVGPALLVIAALTLLLNLTHYAYLFYLKNKQGKP